MNSKSNPFETRKGSTPPANPLSLRRRRLQIKQWFQSCRSATLSLFETVDAEAFRRQAHPDFSPIGWHLGHIVYTEALWILERCASRPPQFSHYHQLFAQDGLPKAERQNLPDFDEICNYAIAIRSQVFAYLDQAPLDREDPLWRFLLQHESQHAETISLVLQLQQTGRRWGWGFGGPRVEHSESGVRSRAPDVNRQGLDLEIRAPESPMPPQNPEMRERLLSPGDLERGDRPDESAPDPQAAAIRSAPAPSHPVMLRIPAGTFEMGNDSPDALDNERPAHEVYVEEFWIDRYPVTCADYRVFMQSGGYQTEAWWSEAGWRWLQQTPVSRPLYWSESSDWDDHPVCGVSWHEANAYARFVNKRLPTEAEWEKAARWHPESGKSSTYPWGDALPTSLHCNHDHWIDHTTPVQAYPYGRSATGCEDLLGNVWEWTSTPFDGYPGFKPYPYVGYSQAYFDGEHKVLRGGSWATRPWALRATFRNWYHPQVRQVFAGFRCASSRG